MARGGLLPPALLGAFSGLVVVVLLQSKTQERLFSTLQPGVVSRTPNSVTGEDGISTAFQSNFRSPAGASGEPAEPPMESKAPAPREVKATFKAPSTSEWRTSRAGSGEEEGWRVQRQGNASGVFISCSTHSSQFRIFFQSTTIGAAMRKSMVWIGLW